jgi:hypothetical protein
LDTLNELAAALGDDPDFATTITNSIATKLPLAGGTMTGAIAMSTNKITGVGDPTAAQDVSSKAYTDQQDALQVTKSGDSMSGNLAMGSNNITGLATPTANDHAVNKSYTDNILGSSTAASTSAANAATSESNAATSETNASNSAAAALNSKNAAATSLATFQNQYLGAQGSAPTADPDGSALDVGDLYFDTTAGAMKVYSANGWTNAGSSVNGTTNRYSYTATTGQTVFAATYDAGYVDVFLNGVKQVIGSTKDVTATTGTSIVFNSATSANDVVDIVGYGTFVLADHLTQAQSDARYVEVTGDTMTGNLGIGISPVTHNGNAKTLHVDGGAYASELRLTNTTTGSASANGFHIAQVGDTSYVVQNENAPLNFYTNAAYAAQFDASGNFLVGKLSNGLANDGLELSSTGYVGASISNDVAAYFNRRGNAGDVVSIMDDQVQVGALSTGSGGYMAIRGGNNTFGSGLLFGNVSIKPTSASGVVSDGAVDLGDSGAMFKDLYLSGSAKLGVSGTTPAWVGATSTVVADNLFGFQGGSYSNACYNISVDNNYTYFLHNAYYGSGGWTQRLTGFNPTKLQAGTDGFFFDRAVSTGSDTAISWTALAAFKADTAVFNEGGGDIDFRVETTNHTHALFVDATNQNVNVRGAVTTDPSNSMNIRGNIRLGADSATRGDTIRSAGGASGAYNGMVLMSNHINAADQANTTLPSWLVDIGGSWADGTNFPPSTADSFTIARRAAGGTKYSSAKYLGINSTATVINEDSQDHDFRVESNNSDHMLFVDAGNDRIGVNNASPSSTVHIGRSGLSNTGLTIQSATTSALITLNGRMNNSGSTTTAIEFKDGSTSTTEGSITVTSSGTTYNTTSDRRLKDNIEPIADGTEKLMAMKPVTHTWIADPEADAVHGFIAQEMQEIVPEAVSGDPDGEEMMSMDYGRITPVLVAALQDAHKKIEALEERLAELEAK